MSAADSVELSVVMPVYNEAALIESVVSEWLTMLDASRIDYEFLLYDDGSTDRTPEVVSAIAARAPRLTPLRHSNRGHGPTIMRGYAEARGEWIFQTDSDGEIAASDFLRLWSAREDRDFIAGTRVGRTSPLHRRTVTAASRLVVHLLFGFTVTDVNAPFRLMRASWLRKQLPLLRPGTTVPNVILSGLAARGGTRVLEVPVTHVGRSAGTSSLHFGKVASYSLRAVIETLGVALRARLR